jgi:hypothetical protein
VVCFLWLPEGMFGAVAVWLDRLTTKRDVGAAAKAIS